MRFGSNKQRKLKLNRDQFSAVERLAVYEAVNFLLISQLDLQRLFGLRPEEFEVFQLVVLATVQRYVRAAGSDGVKLDRTPLGPEKTGAISRRRIAETLDIPLETVRRHVAHLMDKGLVVERGRGRIATPGGTLSRASTVGETLRLAQRHLALTNKLIQLGVLTDRSGSDTQNTNATGQF
ncbi:MAG: winged helix-turn-helix transcriptional regulator [Paracoccaceae bacterium]